MSDAVEKALGQFGQIVDPHQEPVVYAAFVQKVNRKNDYDQRFCVITTAGLYLLTMNRLTKIPKIRRMYPWINLISFETRRSTQQAIFRFDIDGDDKDGNLILVVEDLPTFENEIASLLFELLPETHPATIKVKPQSRSQISVSFVDLVISQFHSVKLPIDPQIIKDLRNVMKSRNPLIISKPGYSDIVIRALCSALVYSRDVKSVKLGGENFPSLFLVISKILLNNHTIESVTLFDHQSSDGYDNFIESLDESSLTVLNFQNIPFTAEMAAQLSDIFPLTQIRSLKFAQCGLGKHKSARVLFKNPENFVQLHEIYISHDDVASFFEPLFQWIVIANIPELAIPNNDLDIFSVFAQVASHETHLFKLDVSKNVASSNYTGPFTFPGTLSHLNMSKVVWEGNSMLAAMSTQGYQMTIDLDYSEAEIDHNQALLLLSQLPTDPPFMRVRDFKWDSNPISSSFFAYASKLKHLRELNINSCVYLKAEQFTLLNSIAEFINSLKLKGLLMKKTLASFGPKIMPALKPVLMTHPTLTRIDLSEDKIGDEGIVILKEVILNNPHIKRIAFDGAGITRYQVLLDFLTFLAGPKIQVSHVSKPHREMDTHKKKEIRAAWSKLSGILSDRQENEADESLTSMNTPPTKLSEEDTTVPPSPVTLLNASWDIVVEVDYDGSAAQWGLLAKQFSYAGITGIPVPIHDPNDLLQFE